MSVERKLQLVVAMMSVISTMLIGLGLNQAEQPIFMVVAAITAYVFSDRLGWLRLNRVAANIAMLAAAIMPVLSFFRSDTVNQLAGIGALLTWVQIVLLFQAKNPRVYGSLAVFSLLQVVVGALLNSGLEFALLATVYLITSILYLTLYCAYRETYRLAMPRNDLNPQPKAAGAASPGSPESRRVQEVKSSLEDRWKNLLESTPRINDRAEMAVFDRRFRDSRLIRRASIIFVPTMLLAVVFFYASPRASRGSWQRQFRFGAASVGFSRRISLDRMADIIQNTDPVLRVSFYEPGTKKPFEVLGGAYLHGSVLSIYSAREQPGNWHHPTTGPGTFLPDPPTEEGLVHQNVLLEPSRENTLFAVWPMYDLEETPNRIRIEQNSRRLMRVTEDDMLGRSHQFQYVLGTTAIRHGDQVALSPYDTQIDAVYKQHELPFLSFDEATLAPIRTVAERVIKESGAENASAMTRARALENYLARSGEFHYSLDLGSVVRNRQIDPVVDFLIHHRTGVCTHFASALALMLRSQGIPSRIVVGYKAGEYNAVGRYYLVRQSDAHAWVEALLDVSEVNPEDLPIGELAPEGAWLRLDPTPAGRGRTQQYYESTLADRLGNVLDYARLLWTEHVLGLNRDRQSSLIYRRVTDQADNAAELLDGDNMRRSIRRFLRSLGVPRNSFIMRLVSFNTLIYFGLVCGGAWSLWRWVRFSWKFRKQALATRRSADSSIDFYRQWEKILRAHGLCREVGQTPREFALAAFTSLSKNRIQLQVPEVAELITSTFYRVRFGKATLDKVERESIEHALRTFEQDLQRPLLTSIAK